MARTESSPIPETGDADESDLAQTRETARMTESLSPTERIQTSRDFRRVKEHGRRYRTEVLRINYLSTTRERSRLGLVVSRRHGNAVRRNRIKRLLRAAFRKTKHELPSSFDLVLLPSSGPRPEVDPSAQPGSRKRTRRLPKRERPRPPDHSLEEYVASLREFASYLRSRSRRAARSAE